MKNLLFSFLFILCSSLPAFGQKITLPDQVKGEVGDFLKIDATTDGTIVKWYCGDPNLSIFPSELLKVSTTTVVIAKKPGTYKLIGYTAKGDVPSDYAVCNIVIGGPAPVPPGPTPVPPGPTPPPVPPNPTPDDAFTKSLLAAYQIDPDPEKKTLTPKLAQLYSVTATAISSGQQTYTTWGQLFDVMTQTARTVGVSGRIKTIQGIIQQELNSTLPRSKDAPFTSQADKDLAVMVFTKISTSLKQITPNE